MTPQRGFTLIELIIFIVIVSVGLTGILSVFNVTASRSADPVVAKQALAVAEAMMEEILSKDFSDTAVDPVGCSSSTTPKCAANTVLDRQHYNDVGDYNGWSQSGVYQLDGTLTPGLGNYTVSVAVTAAALGPAGAVVSLTNAKQVTVTVAGGGASVSLVGWRTNYE